MMVLSALLSVFVLVMGLLKVHVDALKEILRLRLSESNSLDFEVGVETEECTDHKSLRDFHF